MRNDLTNAQETIQTLLPIIVSFVVAWLSVTEFRGKCLEIHASLPPLLRWSSSLTYG
jgi:hypothetical protein